MTHGCRRFRNWGGIQIRDGVFNQATGGRGASSMECGCHPVTFEIAAMLVPPLAWSRPRTRSCLVVLPLESDPRCGLFFVFDLSCFAGLVRGLGLVLNLAI